MSANAEGLATLNIPEIPDTPEGILDGVDIESMLLSAENMSPVLLGALQENLRRREERQRRQEEGLGELIVGEFNSKL